MTKKDYELIADIINRNHSIVGWDFVIDLANALYMNNDRFDTARFIKACGW